jgi:hypothetical protein
MSNETTIERFHRWVVVVCLVAAPLLLVPAIILHPGEGDAGLIESIAASPGRVEAANLLVILSSLLFVPALLGVMRSVTGRGAILTTIGAGLAVIGAVGHAVWAGFQVVLVGLVQSGIDRAQLTALVEGDPPNATFIVVLLMFLVGFFLGMLLLAGGLWRSGIFPKWAAIAIGALALFDFLPIENKALFMVGPVLAVIAFGAIGWTLLRASDASWPGSEVAGAAPAAGPMVEPRPQVQ